MQGSTALMLAMQSANHEAAAALIAAGARQGLGLGACLESETFVCRRRRRGGEEEEGEGGADATPCVSDSRASAPPALFVPDIRTSTMQQFFPRVRLDLKNCRGWTAADFAKGQLIPAFLQQAIACFCQSLHTASFTSFRVWFHRLGVDSLVTVSSRMPQTASPEGLDGDPSECHRVAALAVPDGRAEFFDLLGPSLTE